MDERCKFVIKMIKRSFSSILFLDFDEKSESLHFIHSMSVLVNEIKYVNFYAISSS